MAVIHPDDRLAQLQGQGVQRKPADLHPAVGLFIGFGIITVGAVVVHVLFNVVF
jgi:hypothetical protein